MVGWLFVVCPALSVGKYYSSALFSFLGSLMVVMGSMDQEMINVPV